ncbi:MAG: tRNA (adenosine(37)-N6)-threonylcarbamoyltransferase complex dimerization subunit type 1 TsaB [Candidatus Omnitrophica bacterium]|nr:tRNA (adenosine(37)-N6)-threonylcarbamoyltransferase complex dimerization subunit type 1 TsaB [Candidatus Omnitrophota bacterium]
MRILAIDTTTNFLTLGVYSKGKVFEYNLKTGHKLSQLLAPAIKSVLCALSLKLSDMDYFAAGCGPGSFTGIRLGLSMIKGFSLALNKPAIGESTLDILAMNSPVTSRKIIPAIDAKRGLVYSCTYKYNNGRLKKITPYALIPKDEFIKKINSPSIIFGDALDIYRDDIVRKTLHASFLDKDAWYPKAHNLITLVFERAGKDKKAASFKLNPVYLYPKECQIKK